MTTQAENAAPNRGSADGSLNQVQPEEAVLGLVSNNKKSIQQNACSRESKQPEADAVAQNLNGAGDSPASLISGEKSIHRRGGTTTQTIPSRCVRSPRRLLEVLKAKYGENGYAVEMRHNVYTVVTRDGKGKLSQEDIENC